MRIKTKRMAILMGVGVLLAGTVIVTAVAYAQQRAEGFNEALAPHPEDGQIVAIVNGEAVTRDQIRIGAAASRESSSGIPEDTAIKMALDAAVERAVIIAEASRRGIDGKTEGAQLLEENRRACADPEVGGPCRQLIQAKGMTFDEYWTKAPEMYAAEAQRSLLFAEFVKENSLESAPYAETWGKWRGFVEELKAKAAIEWRDPALRQVYSRS